MRIKNVIVTGILKVLQRINIEDLTVNQLNGLSTSELDSLSGTISNIQEQIRYVRNTVLEADSKARTFKSTIANDINSVVKSDVLDVDSEMSEFSDTIKNSVSMATSDATATADKILVDYNAYVNGELIEGSMPNRGDASVTSNYVVRAANQSTSVNGIISSNGYYNSITINPIVIELKDYTQGNATADKIASGYSAWVNGLKVQGSLPQLGGDVFGGNGSPTCFDESPIVSSAHNSYVGAFDYPLYGWFPKGNHRVHIPNLIPANIKAGVKVGGANGYILGSYTSDANATADKMLSGYTAYVNGNMIRGNIITRDIHWADVSADDVGFDDSGFYMRMPVGYYPQRGSKAGYSYNHMNKSDLGNASAGNVLSGYTFTSQNGLKISGNITQHASSGNVQNDSCWIYSDRIYVGVPTGFYPSGSFGGMGGVSERYVTFGSLASTLGISGNKIIKGNTICGVSGTAATYDEGVNAAKQGTATAGDVLTGKTFTSSSGVNISGSMPDHTGVPSHINHRRLANGRYEVAVEYGRHGCSWAGNSYEYIELNELASDIGLTADKIGLGNTILGISGTYYPDMSRILSRRDFLYSRSKTAPAYDTFYNGNFRVAIGSGNGTNTSNAYFDIVTILDANGQYINRARVGYMSDSDAEYNRYNMLRILDNMCANYHYEGTLSCCVYGGYYLKITDQVGAIMYQKENFKGSYTTHGGTHFRLFRVSSDGSITVSDSVVLAGSGDGANTFDEVVSMAPTLNSKFGITFVREQTVWDGDDITQNDAFLRLLSMRCNNTTLSCGLVDLRTSEDGTTYSYIKLSGSIEEVLYRVYHENIVGDKYYYCPPARYEGWSSDGEKGMVLSYLSRGGDWVRIGPNEKMAYEDWNFGGVYNRCIPICPDPSDPDSWLVKNDGEYTTAQLLLSVSKGYGGFNLLGNAVSLSFE